MCVCDLAKGIYEEHKSFLLKNIAFNSFVLWNIITLKNISLLLSSFSFKFIPRFLHLLPYLS